MSTKQQEEALGYFKAHADDWESKAQSSGRHKVKVNVIQQRNGYVLAVVDDRAQTATALDVGCGTGDLACDLAQHGVAALGVDYAQEMIDLAREKKQAQNLENAQFECVSIFDFDFAGRRYDVIAANGFIEYISQNELRQFFDLVAEGLAPGGSFVVGSRNRLFNLFSLNTYTLNELDGPDSELLMREAVSLASGEDLAGLQALPCAALQRTDTEHANTGIGVTTRFQYTPAQLLQMLHARGLDPVELYPVHIHGVSPAFKGEKPEVHVSISNLLQTHARHNAVLVPFASSFMLHVRKGG